MAYQENRREFLKDIVLTTGIILVGAAIFTNDQPQEQPASGAIKKTNPTLLDTTSPKYIQSELNQLEARLRQQGRSVLLSCLGSVSELAAGQFCSEFQGNYRSPLSPFKLYTSIDFATQSDYQTSQRSLTESLDYPSITTDPITYTDPIENRIRYNIDSFDIRQDNPLAHVYGDFLMEYHHLAAPERSSGLFTLLIPKRFLKTYLPDFDKGLVSYTADQDGNRYSADHTDLEYLVAVQSTRRLLDKLNFPFKMRRDADIATFNRFIDQYNGGDFDRVLQYAQHSEYNSVFEKYYQLKSSQEIAA